MNPYIKKIEQLHAAQVLDQQSLGEVLLDLVNKPDNKERQDQREKLETSIARRDAEIRRLSLMAPAAQSRDVVALAKAEAARATAAEESYVTKANALKARAPKIDEWLSDGLRLFAEQEADSNAAIRAGHEAGISTGALRYLLDLAPLGIALADRLARNGWTKLPFIDVVHPRNTATVEQMTDQRHEKLLGLLEHARKKRAS